MADAANGLVSKRTRKVTKAELLGLAHGASAASPQGVDKDRRQRRAELRKKIAGKPDDGAIPLWESETSAQTEERMAVVCKAVAKLHRGHALIGQARIVLESLTASPLPICWDSENSDMQGVFSSVVSPAYCRRTPLKSRYGMNGETSPRADPVPIDAIGKENECEDTETSVATCTATPEPVLLPDYIIPLAGADAGTGGGSSTKINVVAEQVRRLAKSHSFGKFVHGSHPAISDGTLRTRVGDFLDNALTQAVSASLVLLTMVLICMDTNARSRGSTATVWEDVTMSVCFVAYALEFVAWLYAKGAEVLREFWFYLDCFVITASAVGFVFSAVDGMEGVGLLRLFRLFRLLRLGRLIRALRLMQNVKGLKEPYILTMMMASCLRTLIWAFLLMFFIITLWSILAVELLNEVVRDLAKEEVWDTCYRCEESFASIWESNLTFFQTIVAGDSWGRVALPVIKKKWWSLFIFAGALSSVIFGVLNMIAAVVIDTFAERRAKDVSSMANELEYDELFERKRLEKMFAQIDEDNDGSVTKKELQEGAAGVREFRQYLRVLDIDDKDLSELFDMIDMDNSGEIDLSEFIDALYRMKCTESKTATRFVKHMVGNMWEKQLTMTEKLDKLQEEITRRLNDVEKHFDEQIQDSQNPDRFEELLNVHTDEIEKTLALAIDKAVSVAFDAVLGTAASQASSAIHQVVRASSNMALSKTERARMSDFGSTSSASRQVSGSSVTSASVDSSYHTPRKPKAACLPHSLHVDAVGRTSNPKPNGLIQLGESMLPPVVEVNIDDPMSTNACGA